MPTPIPRQIDPIDATITAWMARHGVTLARISLGLVFFWFGLIKFIPGWSPAEDLSSRTIAVISFGLVQPSLGLPVLAAWEVVIGLGLLTGRFLRITLLLLCLQMIGTFFPLLLFPD
ncbi:MAG: DoxX family membrane protein, partial [Gemmatimonadales bacterium]